MNLFIDELYRAIEQLLGRAGGPMHIRLLIQPLMSITLAIRAGLRDNRENNPPFLWDFIKNETQRKALIRNALKDVGQLVIIAFLIDFVYQIMVLKMFYLLQALIVTFTLALLPYVLLRGLIARFKRRFLDHG